MLRHHFMMAGLKVPYIIKYHAPVSIQFAGLENNTPLTSKKTNDSNSIIKLKVISSEYSNGVGQWTIESNKPTKFYGNIYYQDEHRYADHNDTNLITSLIFPDGLTEMDGQILTSNQSLTSVILPDTLEIIGDNVFDGCENLQEIIIPNSVTSIGESAFNNCSSLTSVTLGNSITSIGYGAFKYCSSLTSITIPDSVTTIGKYAFLGCSGLTSFTVPKNVISMENAFEQCVNLTTIYWNAKSVTESLNGSTSPLGSAREQITSISFGNTVECIPKSLCDGSKLTSLVIPSNVKIINDYAFAGNNNLQDIVLHDDIQWVGSNAFSGTKWYEDQTNIEQDYIYIGKVLYRVEPNVRNAIVNIKDGTLGISPNAFSAAYEQNIIYIPKSVKRIGSYALSPYMNQHEEVRYAGSITDWNNIQFDLYPFGGVKKFYSNDVDIDNLTLPNVETINKYAYGNASFIKSVTIPENVKNISYGTFENCPEITSIHWNAKEINDSEFYRDRTAFSHIAKQITSFTFGDKVQIIPEWLCYGMSNLKEIIIPEGVTQIRMYAFANCHQVEYIKLPSTLNHVSSFAFTQCSHVTSIDIPKNVTYLGSSSFSCPNLTKVNYLGDLVDWCTIDNDSAFWYPYDLYINNTEIKNVTIPNTVFELKQDAFGYSNITSVYIPDNVKMVGESAFSGCKLLTEVTISDNVKSIGKYAFYNCTSLNSILFKNTKQKWNLIKKESTWKSNVPSTCVVHCTDGDIPIADA